MYSLPKYYENDPNIYQSVVRSLGFGIVNGGVRKGSASRFFEKSRTDERNDCDNRRNRK